MQRTYAKRKNTGFTTVELMIVVIIAGILAAIAAPSFSDLINTTRLTSTMSQLTSDLNRARGEAIKRNSWVLICARNTDIACGANWGNGWLVCQDSSNDGADNCDSGTATNPNPITVHPNIKAPLTLTGSAASLRFNPNGTGVPGTLTLVSGTKSRTANIVVTGNISVSNP